MERKMNLMNSLPNFDESVGYLIVKVSTARGASPLSEASVVIRSEVSEDAGVLYSLRTNLDGQTERITLPTPPRAVSEEPSEAIPYATYSIDIFKDGYVPLTFNGVPIFPSILSIQPAVMVPGYANVSNQGTPSATIIPEVPDTGL